MKKDLLEKYSEFNENNTNPESIEIKKQPKEFDFKEAEKVRDNLKQKSKKATIKNEKEMTKRFREFNDISIMDNHISSEPIEIRKHPKEFNFKEAEMVRDNLKNKYQQARLNNLNDVQNREKTFEPITRELKEIKEAVKNTDIDKNKKLDLVPLKKETISFIPKFTSSPNKTNTMSIEEFESDNSEEEIQANKSSDESKNLETVEKIEESQRKHFQTRQIIIGPIAKKHLPYFDNQFGIYYNNEDLFIGNKKVFIRGDDINIENEKYIGTEGLWKLLTKTQDRLCPNENEYTKEDLASYEKILIQTSSMYKQNDPTSKYPKSSTNQKWQNIIRKIWASKKERKGDGLKLYNDKSIQMSPMSYKAIFEKLKLIEGEEEAGNNNTRSEKLTILKTIYKDLQNSIDDPGCLKVLATITDLLSKNISGKGVFNYLLNNLNMPEMHLPGYNYCGPFTDLDRRLERGDQGINKLDEACKKHDIFYKNHKDTESRHIADKVLIKDAEKVFYSSDSSLKEKGEAFLVGNAIKLKTYFGMGINQDSVC